MAPKARGCVEGKFPRIQAQARPRLFQPIDQILFAGHEIERPGLSLVGNDEIKQRVKFRFLLVRGDFRDRLPVVFFQFVILHTGNHHAFSASAVKEQVFPVRMVRSHLLLDLGADRRIMQALQ